MDPVDVREAYGRRAEEYVDLLGSVEAMAEADRARLTGWAAGVDGRILDIGSGPGHWTAHLHDAGTEIEGIDPVAAFIASARARFPGVPFREGSVLSLTDASESARGVLAWYSLIHLPPADLDLAIAEIARVLAPGGSLLCGFFEGAEVAEFDHAVAPAWYRPADEMAARWAAHGFEIVDVERRTDAGRRPHASITARRGDDTLAIGREPELRASPARQP